MRPGEIFAIHCNRCYTQGTKGRRARMRITPEFVREIRQALGISQEGFARKIGVAYNTVNRWEKGKSLPKSSPIIEKILELAREAGIMNKGQESEGQ
jgi:DNA-binding transcriptional regulator YiaG